MGGTSIRHLPLSSFQIHHHLTIRYSTVHILIKISPLQALEAYRVEMLRIPYCPDNRLTDGGKDASPMHRPTNILFFLFLVLISVRGVVNPRT
jgi:hypothetical protein